MRIRELNRMYGMLLRWLMKFNHMGKGVTISPSCEIRRGAAPYISIGDHVSIGKDVWLNIPYEVSQYDVHIPVLKIGDGTAIGRRCMITALNYIEIGDHVLFGPGVFIGDHSHAYHDKAKAIMHQGVTEPGSIIIEDGCWLGYNCAVVTGKGREIRIGRNSVIGANAVVTNSFPAYSVLVGNPARNLNESL